MFDIMFNMTRTADPLADVAALTACHIGSCDSTAAIGVAHRIRRLRGWIDRVEAELTTHVNGLYEQGTGAPAVDLHTRSQGVSAAEARKKERRAKALEQAPSFGDALANGAVGAEHADALANATTSLDDDTKNAFFGHEQSLLGEARNSTPEQFRRHCRDLLDRIRRQHGVERAERQRAQTSLRRSIDARTGMYRLNAEFHPELGARIFGAIDAEVAALVAAGDDRQVDRNRVAADALGNLVSGGHQAARPGLAEISVLIDLPTLTKGLHEHSICELHDGTATPVSMVRRLCCEAEIIPVVLNGDGVAVDVGRKQRLANRAQRRALRAMYRNCAFQGCDVAFERCEIHHLVEWDDLGPTDLGNLLPLCSRHHHVIHEGGWQLDLTADRELTIRQPDGEVFAVCELQIHRDRRRRRSGYQPKPETLTA